MPVVVCSWLVFTAFVFQPVSLFIHLRICNLNFLTVVAPSIVIVIGIVITVVPRLTSHGLVRCSILTSFVPRPNVLNQAREFVRPVLKVSLNC
jgi:hypothetical protein